MFDWDVGSNFVLTDSGIEVDGTNVTTYRLVNHKPLSEALTEQSAALSSDLFDVSIEATGRMTADRDRFLVTMTLDGRDHGERVHTRQWRLEFLRVGT